MATKLKYQHQIEKNLLHCYPIGQLYDGDIMSKQNRFEIKRIYDNLQKLVCCLDWNLPHLVTRNQTTAGHDPQTSWDREKYQEVIFRKAQVVPAKGNGKEIQIC